VGGDWRGEYDCCLNEGEGGIVDGSGVGTDVGGGGDVGGDVFLSNSNTSVN